MLVDSQSFKQALTDLGQVIGKRPIDPVLGCVLIQFKEEDLLLTANDIYFWLQIRMDSHTDRPIDEYHTLAIPYKSLSPLLGAGAIKVEKIEVKCSGLDLEVHCGTKKHLIPGMKCDDFPEFETPNIEDAKGWLYIEQKEVSNVLDVCRRYASPDPTRMILTGINLRVEKDEVIAESTEGIYWAAQARFAVQSESTFNFKIPSSLSTRLLKLKKVWQKLSIAAYDDCVMASDETCCMRFRFDVQHLIGNYPSIDRLFDHTIADSIVSRINPKELIRFIKAMDKSYDRVMVLTENQNFHVCGINNSLSITTQTSIPRSGSGFAWACLDTEKLIQLCTLPKDVKEIALHIKRDCRNLAAVIIEYSSECHSFTCGLTQLSFPKKGFIHDKQEELIEFYSQIPEVVEVKVEECEDIFSVSDEMFPDGFFDDDDL